MSPLPASTFNLPVRVGSNLGDLWLPTFKDLLLIGDVEEEKLHVDGRGRIFPWREHSATLN